MAFRAVLVGAGVIGDYHAKQLAKLDAEVVGVQDIDAERAEELAESTGARPYTDHIEMYDEESPDAVFIGIPPFAHTDQETAAAERGINIFTQKPPALTVDKAQEVLAAIRANDVVSAVGFQDRYLNLADAMREFLADRPAGVTMGYWMGGIYPPSWWRRKEQSGGQAVEQTIHIFDLVRYLRGEVVRVYASATTGIVDLDEWEGFNIEDASIVNLEFADGTAGVITSACFLTQGGRGRSGIDIYCPDASVSYTLRRSVTLQEEGESTTIRRQGDNDRICIETFVDACRGTGPREAIRSPYEDAARTLEVVLAANRSLETGEPVDLPLS